MLTFPQARDIVDAAFRDEWVGPGTFYVSERGLEDADAFMVSWGSREHIVDEDPAYATHDNVVTFVRKADGELEVFNVPEVWDRMHEMASVTA